MKRLRIVPFRDDTEREAHLPLVLEHLRAGGLIAYPTETVYGFGSLLLPEALERLRMLKGRPEEKPFLLLVPDADSLDGVDWTSPAKALAKRFWPGPLTLALRATRDFPPSVVSSEGTVAARSSPHPAARVLAAAAGAITSTSANMPGDTAASTAHQVAELLLRLGAFDVWLLDGGALPPSSASTIVDCACVPPRLIRAGAVPLEEIEKVIGAITHG